ncbi:MAG: 16S rRNA (guanine(527)-N(7))-methyltransferase RsmG [Bifidobacteriaceae bacterium]|jgi:16S rRNA (guanine527-N7)-methyltransferase|nr:16S rRNA (guanine(527)-N(7))-methyltransferase RsmG [Bifidobacteriaceae bacterium]
MKLNSGQFDTFEEFVISKFQNPELVAQRAFENIIEKAKENEKNLQKNASFQKSKTKNIEVSNIWQKGFLLADLLSKWSLIVSPELTKICQPDKIILDKLYIKTNTDNIKKFFLQHEELVLQRINKYTNNKIIKGIYVNYDKINKTRQELFFGSVNFDKIQKFYFNIYKNGVEYGLIGPKELDILWDRHFVNSALLNKFLESQFTKICDVGTGGGFPGLVLAILNPNKEFTFIESIAKRCSWLDKQANLLGLQNIEIINKRSEDIKDKKFEIVTSRAVAELKKLIPQTVHLLEEEGQLICLKGRSINDEIDKAKPVLIKSKLRDIKIVRVFPNEISASKTIDFSFYSPAIVFAAKK